MTNEKR